MASSGVMSNAAARASRTDSFLLRTVSLSRWRPPWLVHDARVRVGASIGVCTFIRFSCNWRKAGDGLMALKIFDVSFLEEFADLIDEKVRRQFGRGSDFLRAAAVRYLMPR